MTGQTDVSSHVIPSQCIQLMHQVHSLSCIVLGAVLNTSKCTVAAEILPMLFLGKFHIKGIRGKDYREQDARACLIDMNLLLRW